MKKGWEMIIKVTGEGGSIKLEAIKDENNKWIKYRKIANDTMFCEELRIRPQIDSKDRNDDSKFVANSWAEALKILNVRGLFALHPVFVHDDFKSRLYDELVKTNKTGRSIYYWNEICKPTKIEELALLMKNSKYTVVLTGAGMDTESNIPDFRSKNGWWRNLDPREVASTEALKNNYELFREFYIMRINDLEKCNPHEGHYILSQLEEEGIIHSIATQNVSGLHLKAGSKRVYELHGSIQRIKCNKCSHFNEIDDFIMNNDCKFCDKGKLRPDVTLFGEMLPQAAWDTVIEEVNQSELLIVIGTSLEVYPVNQIPKMAKGKTVLINMEDNLDMEFELKITGRAKEVLKEVFRIIRE